MNFFSVLCNNPKKYAVVEPEGRILGQKCVDIVVRHVAVSPVAVQQTDKFRIHIYDSASSDAEVAGKRDILATLHPGRQLPTSGSSKPKTKYSSCDKSKGSRFIVNSLSQNRSKQILKHIFHWHIFVYTGVINLITYLVMLMRSV